MREPLQLELSPDVCRVLKLAAHAGIIGDTAEEVATYLIMRELDDLMRAGVLKLGDGS